MGIMLIALMASPVFAEDITIFDGWNDPASSNPWYKTKAENSDVEPGNVATQIWDLESFDLTGTTLSTVGGFDFVNGVKDPYYDQNFNPNYKNKDDFWWKLLNKYVEMTKIVQAGDIFIDIDNNAKYGSNVGTITYANSKTKDALAEGKSAKIKNTFGWDFVIVPDFANMTYDVYQIDQNSILWSPYYKTNLKASPWTYAEGGTLVLGGQELVMLNPWKDGEGWHYGFEVDLGFLLDYGLDYEQLFLVHTTIECGNDMMMGQGYFSEPPVHTPEPSTIILLGAGLVGLGLYTRKRFNA
jgi:hypothetical protein